jgi:hypothetical protein
MKKTFAAGIFAALFLAVGAGAVTARAAQPSAIQAEAPVSDVVTVHIELVNTLTGGSVYNHGLHGYWAQNQETSEYYYSGQGDNFEELPEGTYVFGAFNGYWDGASSKVVTLDAANGNYTVVTLNYWSE